MDEPCRPRIGAITGVLCVCQGGNVFLQALEGGRDAVNALYGRIVQDPRHRDVTLLDYAEIDERRFAGWRMGSVDSARSTPARCCASPRSRSSIPSR